MSISEARMTRAAEALADQLKAGAPIDYVLHQGGNDYNFDGTLNVLDLAQTVLLAADWPIVVPDRDDLARELFIADNARQTREDSIDDWAHLTPRHREYAYVMADAAIEQFRKANR